MARENHHFSLTPEEAEAPRDLARSHGRGNLSATVGTLIRQAAARIRRGDRGETRPSGSVEPGR